MYVESRYGAWRPMQKPHYVYAKQEGQQRAYTACNHYLRQLYKRRCVPRLDFLAGSTSAQLRHATLDVFRVSL